MSLFQIWLFVGLFGILIFRLISLVRSAMRVQFSVKTFVDLWITLGIGIFLVHFFIYPYYSSLRGVWHPADNLIRTFFVHNDDCSRVMLETSEESDLRVKSIVVDDFDSVSVKCFGKVHLIQSSSSNQKNKIVIRAPEDTIKSLNTSVINGRLTLGVAGDFCGNLNGPVFYEVNFKDLVKIKTTGCVDLDCEYMESENLVIDSTGNSRFKIKKLKVADKFRVNCHGMSRGRIHEFEGGQLILNGHGNSTMSIKNGNADYLDVNLAGMSELWAVKMDVDSADIKVKGQSAVALGEVQNSIKHSVKGGGSLVWYESGKKKAVSRF